MTLKYNYAESTSEPAELEVFSDIVYLRKDIIAEDRTNQDETYTMYTYQECVLSKTEYQEYLNEIQSVTMQTIMQTLTAMQLSIDEL